MIKEEINTYLSSGGKLFNVLSIDIIRDGGTKAIKTTQGIYYIDKKSYNIHSAYPTSDENLINDSSHKKYLIERIESYLIKCESNLKRNKEILFKIWKHK